MAVGGGCEQLPTGMPDPAPHLESKGMTVGDWTSFGIALPAGRRALEEMAAVGVDTAVFLVTIYQETTTSSEFDTGTITTPNLQAFTEASSYAQSLGLRVALKLHVDVRDDSWRGEIDPADADAWFAAYRLVVEDCAAVAEGNGATHFIVGTELGRTLQYEARWRDVIAVARANFAGRLLYAASWDEAQIVPFWDALDAMGIDAYFPVSDRLDPSRLELLAGWQPWLNHLESMAKRSGKKIYFTEIGYMSRDGAGMQPALYGGSAFLDAEEQADLYWAALQVVAEEDWIRGVWWWNWELSREGGPGDVGYTPRGKPALDVLESAWGQP